jgi:hypothetical protein
VISPVAEDLLTYAQARQLAAYPLKEVAGIRVRAAAKLQERGTAKVVGVVPLGKTGEQDGLAGTGLAEQEESRDKRFFGDDLVGILGSDSTVRFDQVPDATGWCEFLLYRIGSAFA